MTIEKPTFLEKVSGNLGTTVSATLVAASGGAYLAPLLPALFGSIANNRYQERVSRALVELDEKFNKITDKVEKISDSQFKLINDVISVTLSTTDSEKIEILKKAAIGSVYHSELNEHDAIIIGRVLRDITVVEYAFLVSISSYKEISVFDPPLPEHELREGQVVFLPDSRESEILNGLNNLGLVVRAHSGFGGNDFFYSLTSIGSRLIEICQ